jgi:hypothetical protein
VTTPLDPRRCPLCGNSNACGMAEGKSTCWCFDVKIAPEVIESIPAEAQDEVCICEKCATAQAARGVPQATER